MSTTLRILAAMLATLVLGSCVDLPADHVAATRAGSAMAFPVQQPKSVMTAGLARIAYGLGKPRTRRRRSSAARPCCKRSRTNARTRSPGSSRPTRTASRRFSGASRPSGPTVGCGPSWAAATRKRSLRSTAFRGATYSATTSSSAATSTRRRRSRSRSSWGPTPLRRCATLQPPRRRPPPPAAPNCSSKGRRATTSCRSSRGSLRSSSNGSRRN